MECGRTKLVCSVFDPKEVPNKVEYAKTGELQCEFKFATFSCRQRRAYTRDSEERQLCNEFRRALEPAICRVSLCKNWYIDILNLKIPGLLSVFRYTSFNILLELAIGNFHRFDVPNFLGYKSELMN